MEGPPARENVEIRAGDGSIVGKVTSGTHSPSLKKSIGQGYVKKEYSKVGTELSVSLRQKEYKLKVEKMPFVAAKYYKIN